MGNKGVIIKELQTTAHVYADIAKMIEPENICFVIDQDFLEMYPPFVQAIRDANEWASVESTNGDNVGNFYSSTGLELTKSQTISLLQDYDGFHVTNNNYTNPNGLFTYNQQHFSCGFVYQSSIINSAYHLKRLMRFID
jgi:hypothetical protein